MVNAQPGISARKWDANIVRDFEIQTDSPFSARRPDPQTVDEKEKMPDSGLYSFGCLQRKLKEYEKRDK